MEIVLDFSFIQELSQLPPYLIVWKLFISGGWVLLLFVIFAVWYANWIGKRRGKFLEVVEYVLLAIDVPKINEQGPKAVESIFAQLAAAESGAKTFKEKNLQGMMETPVSLEIISMEGYIQFLIRLPKGLRDLAETAIYAQYPEAEITEVEDYASWAPTTFPNNEYDLWGTELVLYQPSPYPIRTHLEFEDPTAMDRFKDPMASILEVMSKLGQSENLWLQILLVPAQPDWTKEGKDVINKILGAKVTAPRTIVDIILDFPLKILGLVHDQVFSTTSGPEVKPQDTPPGKPGDLTPGARHVLEAVQNKLSKIAFKSKIRFLYWGRKEVFSKGRGVAAFMGALKQFNTLDMNGFMPDKITKTSGEGFSPLKDLANKQMSLVKNYATRAFSKGAKSFILNTEELATIYHFPVKAVKSPMLKTSETRRAEAPVSLPIEVPIVSEGDANFPFSDNNISAGQADSRQTFENGADSDEKNIAPAAEPPTDLPVA